MSGKRAWYLGCNADQVADRVILLGDPGRVERLSRHLRDVEQVSVNRGLNTVTGWHGDCRVTLSAFGMGAPIAAIVLHELAELGSRVFLRLGTSIGLAPVKIGDVVIARDAKSYDGTSAAYAPGAGTSVAHPDVVRTLGEAAATQPVDVHLATFASFDAFYQDMFALNGKTQSRVRQNFKNLTKDGVTAIDMETSAILTVGKVLGCKAGSLCASTVDSLTRAKLPAAELEAVEKALITIALDALSRIDPG